MPCQVFGARERFAAHAALVSHRRRRSRCHVSPLMSEARYVRQHLGGAAYASILDRPNPCVVSRARGGRRHDVPHRYMYGVVGCLLGFIFSSHPHPHTVIPPARPPAPTTPQPHNPTFAYSRSPHSEPVRQRSLARTCLGLASRDENPRSAAVTSRWHTSPSALPVSWVTGFLTIPRTARAASRPIPSLPPPCDGGFIPFAHH